jgi:hypothetical protein
MKYALLMSFCVLFAAGIATMRESTAWADAPTSQAEFAASAASAAAADVVPASDGEGALDLRRWIRTNPMEAMGFGGALLVTLAVTCTMLALAGRITVPAYIPRLGASFFFWLEMGYLVLLLIVAGLYLSVLPPNHSAHLVGGVLPIGVPWFGALGAVVISLEGIFAYGQKNWDPKYNYWHIGRPLFGAVLGIVAFYTYLLIIMSAGAYPPFITTGSSPAAKDFIVYYVVAFLVGYREETFRELIRRVTDLILKPGATAGNEPVVTFKQNGVVISHLDFAKVAAHSSKTLTIDVENTGKDVLKAPKVALGTPSASEFSVAKDTLTGSPELKPGDVKAIDIKFAPTTVGAAYAGTLTVTGSNLAAPTQLALSGKG